MSKLKVSILILLLGAAGSAWIQYQVTIETPKLEDYSVVSTFKPVQYSTRKTSGKRSYEILSFSVEEHSFTMTDDNPYYEDVLVAVSRGGKLRIWYNSNQSSEVIYQITQNGNIVAPFNKLLHINGYSGSGAQVIPILIACLFIFGWYRKNDT